MEPATPAAPPPTLGGSGDTRYELDDSLIAMHGGGPAKGASTPVASLEGGDITIVPAGQASGRPKRTGPVYRAGPGGPIAVPTGRVFVRFREGTSAESKREEVAAAGFAVESVPAYAPHAAWVRPASERVTDALVDLDRLQRLPGVERVEPQLVSEAEHKG